MAFLEALFWFGIAALGVGPFFIFPEGKVKRAYGITLTFLGILACAYSVYRHYHSEVVPQFPLWIILWILTWVLLGYDIYLRRVSPQVENTETSGEWRTGFSRPRFEIVDDRKFENEEIVVDNKSFRRCSFKNVKLLFHGRAPFEFVEGTTLDQDTVFLTTDDPAIMVFNVVQRKFASLPGAKIEHGALDSKGKEVSLTPLTVEPILNPEKPSKLSATLRQRTIALSDDLKGFLMEHGPKPVSSGDLEEHMAAVTPWRNKLGADFRLRFCERVKRLRDEIQVQAGFSELTLDNAIANAEKRVCDEKAIEEIRQCLWKFAYNMNK